MRWISEEDFSNIIKAVRQSAIEQQKGKGITSFCVQAINTIQNRATDKVKELPTSPHLDGWYCINKELLDKIIDKINELIDIVNELKKKS